MDKASERRTVRCVPWRALCDGVHYVYPHSLTHRISHVAILTPSFKSLDESSGYCLAQLLNPRYTRSTPVHGAWPTLSGIPAGCIAAHEKAGTQSEVFFTSRESQAWCYSAPQLCFPRALQSSSSQVSHWAVRLYNTRCLSTALGPSHSRRAVSGYIKLGRNLL